MSKLIVIVAFDGVTSVDVVAPIDVFHAANVYSGPGGKHPYETNIASVNGGAVTSMSGVAINTVPLDTIDAGTIDTLIVPGGGPPTDPPVPEDLVAWLATHANGIRRICGICTGTFLLAAAGLVDGKKVTTHWQAASLFQDRHCNIDVDVDSIFLRDGHVWTSAGFSTGTDLTLALIEEDEGYEQAVKLAKIMVVFFKRSGSQSQFSVPLAVQEKSDYRFSRLHAWIVDNLTEDLSVERLAEQANMSVRTLLRHYKQNIGCTPNKTVETLRLEHACDCLVSSDASIKHIAKISGFGAQQNMRRAFLRSLDMTPQKYRELHRDGR